MEVLVFSGVWCPHCVEFKESLERAGIRFKVLDVEEHADFASKYPLTSLPSTLFRKGDQDFGLIVGMCSPDDVWEKINLAKDF